MGSSLFRLKVAAESSLRCNSRRIFRSPSCCGSKLGARMLSTLMRVSSDESVVSGPYSSSLPSRISPWLMLPPAFEGGDMVYKFYSLAEKKVVSLNKRGRGSGREEEEEELESPGDDAEFVGSSHGWLVTYNRHKGDMFLTNPLSRRHIKLPSPHNLPEEVRWGCGGMPVRSVVISCSPDEEDCRAMMIYCPQDRLAFCWPGRSKEWTLLGALYHEFQGGKCARCYEDCVYSSRHKLFFCVTEYDCLEGWDIGDTGSPRLDWLVEEDDPWAASSEEDSEAELKDLCLQLKYLVFVEQSNELFLVTRHIMEQMAPDGSYIEDNAYPYKTIGFDVHKIDRTQDGGKLRCMEGSLDGMAMFIGTNHSFAVSAAEFPELNLKPNSIYFTDDRKLTPTKWVDATYGGHDIGIFNYETRTLSPCYYPCDVQSIKRILPAPAWFTPSPH